MTLLLIDFFDPIISMKLLCMTFLGVLFTQSGLDKVFNYQGNYEWIKGHFSKSPLKNTVGLLMPTITFLEAAAGILSLVGVILFILDGSTQIALIGAQLSALSILALFVGQRLAQDYVGAANLVHYFIMCIISIYVIGL